MVTMPIKTPEYIGKTAAAKRLLGDDIVDTIENNGCSFVGVYKHSYIDEHYAKLEWRSSNGNDIVFRVTADDPKSFVDSFIEYAMVDFDVDKQAAIWYNENSEVNETPKSLETMLEDAKTTKELLHKIAKELSMNIQTKTNRNNNRMERG